MSHSLSHNQLSDVMLRTVLLLALSALANALVVMPSTPRLASTAARRALTRMDDTPMSGKCKWFNVEKGYGFIQLDDEERDVFVHQSDIYAPGFRSLAEGEALEFRLTTDDKTGKVKAVDVTGPDGAYVSPRRTTSNDCRAPPDRSTMRAASCFLSSATAPQACLHTTLPPSPLNRFRALRRTPTTTIKLTCLGSWVWPRSGDAVLADNCAHGGRRGARVLHVAARHASSAGGCDEELLDKEEEEGQEARGPRGRRAKRQSSGLAPFGRSATLV